MTTPPKTALSLVDEALTLYCESSTTVEPAICRTIREEAQTHPSAHWTSGPLVGTLLKILVSAMRAERVLDIGTFLGYSAAYMASANEAVRVVSLERDPVTANRARTLLAASPIGAQVTIELVEAHDWLLTGASRDLDLVFFDSNRSDLMLLYPLLKTVLRPGGVLVMDNACLRRKVLSPSRPWENDTVAFNSTIQLDPDFLATILPIRDGVLVAYKLGAQQ